MVKIHPFEVAGLGLAPFRFSGMSEKVYVACPGAPVQAAGSCDYCGTGIRYCCHVVSSDGKAFIVGCDCVRKLNREDNAMVSEMERALAKLEREKRDAERRAEWERRRLEQEAEWQAQRERNGGLTDFEVADRERLAREKAVANQFIAKNGWLIDVLNRVRYSSDFIDGMLQELHRREASSLSGRCRGILRDIYAKTASGKSRNSKAFKAAEEEFERLIDS